MNTNNENVATKERYYNIENGPSKDRLFDSCKYAYDKTARVYADFVVALAYTQPKGRPGCAYVPMKLTDVRIASIQYEDGSGESFNISGYCKANLTVLANVEAPLTNYRFEGYYNSKSRTGTVRFFE